MVYVYVAVNDNIAGVHIQHDNGTVLCDATVNCDTRRKYTGILTAMQLAVKKLLRLQTANYLAGNEQIRVLVPSTVVYGWCKEGKSESYANEFDAIYTGFAQLYADVEFICIGSDVKINRAYGICENTSNALMNFTNAFAE